MFKIQNDEASIRVICVICGSFPSGFVASCEKNSLSWFRILAVMKLVGD